MHFRPEEFMCQCATTYQRSGDIVQEARKNPHYAQQHQAAFPIVRQILWQNQSQMAFLEMAREHREAQQQAHQVSEDDPLLLHMGNKPDQASSHLKAREEDFVQRNRKQSRKRHAECVLMEHRHTNQSQAE
jgi:hypothetical protein